MSRTKLKDEAWELHVKHSSSVFVDNPTRHAEIHLSLDDVGPDEGPKVRPEPKAPVKVKKYIFRRLLIYLGLMFGILKNN